MIGTVVNSLAVIIGALFGLVIGQRIKKNARDTLMDGMGLSLMILGIASGVKSENVLLLVVSIVIGIIIGETVNIQNKLDRLGNNLQDKFGKGDNQFSSAFVTASLVTCAGAMSIVGSIESGIYGDHTTMFVKSLLDGVLCLLLASNLGIGVAFSGITIFVYQGIITMAATGIGRFLTPEIVNEMSAVGGVLILAIGINLLEFKTIRVANIIPAIFIPLIYYVLMQFANLV